MDEKCFFECSNDSTDLINCGEARIETIRKCSQRREDGFINRLIGVKKIKCHKNCVSTYTSPQHLKRYLSKQIDSIPVTEKEFPYKKSQKIQFNRIHLQRTLYFLW